MIETIKNKTHWKEIGISFLIVLIYVLFLQLCTEVYAAHTGSYYLGGIEKSSLNFFRILHLVFTTIVAFGAFIKNTSKYKNGIPAWAVFLLMGGLGVLGTWVVFYRFLLIKKELKIRIKDE